MSKPTTTRFIAFMAVMSALSNVLGFLVLPIGVMTLHLIQLPMVFSGLAAGPLAGGLVGFFGAFVMAFTLPKPNPYIIVGNAILGFLTGSFYMRLKNMTTKPVLPQMLSVLLACAVQMPYVYLTDVYLMGMPHAVVMGIIGVLFVEDLLSGFISHIVLYRLDVNAILAHR